MNEDKILQKLSEHDEQLEFIHENMVTRDEFLSSQDKMMVILMRLDEERIFTNAWISKFEKEVNEQKDKIQEHEEVLSRIKLELHIT